MSWKGLILIWLAGAGTIASSQADLRRPQETPIQVPRETNEIALGSASAVDGVTEAWFKLGEKRIVRNVSVATLTPVLPKPELATGAALVVAPGGAYMLLSIDNEGYDVAHWLADHGVAAFVLKYRLRPTSRDPNEFRRSLEQVLSGASANSVGAVGEGAAPLASSALSLSSPQADGDARTAIRIVRQRAKEWRIDPHRIGMIGFSAGAMTALRVGLAARGDERPDFIATIYGPLDAQDVPADAPPLFAVLAADDRLMGRTDFGLIQRYRAANRPFEFHVFERGGHGFGMTRQGTSSDLWIDELHAWMKSRDLLDRVRIEN